MSAIQPRAIGRLIDSGHADEPWALIVLAALERDQELEAYLDKPSVHGSGSLRIHAATAWYVAELGGLECAGPLRWITSYHVLCLEKVVNR